MEKGLRDCCRSMRIGKILIRRDHDTHIPKVNILFSNFFSPMGKEGLAARLLLLLDRSWHNYTITVV